MCMMGASNFSVTFTNGYCAVYISGIYDGHTATAGR